MSNVTLQSFIGPNFWQTLVIAQSGKDLADLRRHHVGGNVNDDDDNDDINDDNPDNDDDDDDYDDENDDNDHDDDDATKAPTDEPKKCKNNIPS